MIRPQIAWIILGVMMSAATLGAVELPTPLKEVKPEPTLVGAATLHWFGLHVYDVALYAPETAYTTNGTAVLSIRYNMAVKRQRLLDTARKEWGRMGIGTKEQREAWLQRLETIWLDVKSGESLTAFRQQAGATRFYFGDKLLGEVADPEFGPAFFAIWLGADCSYPKVRDGLLGVKKEKRKDRER